MAASHRPGEYFRAGVGAIIARPDGRVLAFERSAIPGAWQLPQGGLERGEDPLAGVVREVLEETGIRLDPERQLRERVMPLLAYELPVEHRTKKTGRGQAHYWFVFGVGENEVEPDLSASVEFTRWAWVRFSDLVGKCVPFRQPVYLALARHVPAHPASGETPVST